LSRSFEREGHRVLAVPDAESALDRAATEDFDIVLLDVALGPGLDGYDVCRMLRSRRNVVPVIMLTARDSEADAVLGLEAGADDYVTKPFGYADVRSRIRAVLRRARLVAALLFTSAVTLGIAALALLPPLERRLRRDQLAALVTAAVAFRPQLEDLEVSAARPGNLELARLARSLERKTGAHAVV